MAPLAKPIKSGAKERDNGRPRSGWRHIAGPQLTPNQFHCAIIPDGPGGQWKGGEYERTEAKNKALRKAAEEAEIAANGDFADPDWREVISPDGVKCFVTKFSAPKKPIAIERIADLLPGDLSIPQFLRWSLP